MRATSRSILYLILFAPAGLAQSAGTPYANRADWTSYTSGVSTGGALADIDGDGHLDFVVANGNDISRQKVDVFTNDGAGNFPLNPQWTSTDVDYHGHLSVGDVDRDGDLDLAVSVFLGPGGFGDPGRAKLYVNQGTALERTPSWQTADTFFSFSCDFGDADSDGDLDLAVAVGEPYFDPPGPNRIYYNAGTALATSPAWLSSPSDHSLDVAFGDADGDGDLDLASATALGPTRVYYQGAGGISTTAGWTAADNLSGNGNTIFWSDLDGDGFRELLVSDNDQLSGGSGDFKAYRNTAGSLATRPYWTSFGGFVSGIATVDTDFDGFPEVLGGLWFGGSRIYDNASGTPATSSAWSSTVRNTVEVIVLGDVEGNGLRVASAERHAPNGRTYYAGHAPIHELVEVRVDGVALATRAYSVDLEDGWIALAATPAASVELDYVWSESLDVGVTSWDSSIGNQLYRRAAVPRATFRNDARALNPAGYVATRPFLGARWTATVDNTGSGNTLATILGYALPAEQRLPCCGVVLMNLASPGGELLGLPFVAGTGVVVAFSGTLPNDLALAGVAVATQGVSLGGGAGIRLHNAYDLVAGF